MGRTSDWPNLLIIGAVKAGTTSLYHYLKDHPEVYMPAVKEPHFFSGTHPAYSDQEKYLDLFKDKCDAKFWGEASVEYLVCPEACRKIHYQLGEKVKLICLLRNPAKAIYSHWGQLTRIFFEVRPAEEAIDASFLLDGWDAETWLSRYAWFVDYATHLDRYYSVFSEKQIKVYFFEEFFLPGLPQWPDLCSFLGISFCDTPEQIAHNKGHLWKNKMLSTFLAHQYERVLAPVANRLFPQAIRTCVRDMLLDLNTKPLPPMPEHLYAKLKTKLSPGVRELERLLGRDLSAIWF